MSILKYCRRYFTLNAHADGDCQELTVFNTFCNLNYYILTNVSMLLEGICKMIACKFY